MSNRDEKNSSEKRGLDFEKEKKGLRWLEANCAARQAKTKHKKLSIWRRRIKSRKEQQEMRYKIEKEKKKQDGGRGRGRGRDARRREEQL